MSKKKGIAGKPLTTINEEIRQAKFVPTGQARYAPPNPFYDRVEYIVEQRARLRELSEQCIALGELHQQEGIGMNMFDIESIMHDPVMAQIREEFDRIMDELDEMDDTPVDMPPPPHASAAMERVAQGESVLEIGCGNNPEILRPLAEGKDYLGLDPEVDVEVDEEEFRMLSGLFKGHEHLLNDRIVVTRNVLTQLDEEDVGTLEQCDGVHVYPDIESLAERGIAKPGDAGTFISTSKGKTFTDRIVRLPSCEIKDGYRGANTWATEELLVSLMPEKRSGGAGFTPQCNAIIHAYSDDVTYKYDGVCWQLRCKDGIAELVNRKGDFYRGTINTRKRVIMDLEMMGGPMGKRGPVFAVILRVRCYGGIQPFHSGEGLRHFATKHNMQISISDIRYNVIGPLQASKEPLYDGQKFDHDGIITRADERDFYVKTDWTIDVRNLENVVQKLEGEGYGVTVVGGVHGELWEYVLSIHGTQVIMKALTQRCDKEREDNFHTILFKITGVATNV